MIHFKIAPHRDEPGVEIVEIWDDDVRLGALYPGAERDVRLMTRHMDFDDLDRHPVKWEIRPVGTSSVTVRFNKGHGRG